MASRVLLTGATGFVGQTLGHELHERGHSLASLVRGADPSARLERAGVPGRACPGGLEDANAVRAAVSGADVVVHAAAIVDPALQGDERALCHVNRDLTMELARLAKDAGVRRFVFVSSIAAMGFWSGIATSRSVCRPETAYGRAKLEAEQALASLASIDFEIVMLRLPTVYGPGERYNFLSWARAVDRKIFRIIGKGANVMPLCTTRNAALAVRGAVEGRLGGGVYLVADAEPYSVARIHRALLLAFGRDEPRLQLPRSLAWVAGFVNEAVAARVPGLPVLLTRARVRTLTVDQPFDVRPLLEAGIELDAPLEEWVGRTVEDYRRRGLVGRL
jgi:nucleoside-diphosphate-sugar epimerase